MDSQLPTSTIPDETTQNRRRGDRRTAAQDHENAVLSALLEISNYVGSVMVLDEILKKILEVTCRVMDAQSCSIYLWDDAREHLVMRCNLGLDPSLIGRAAFDLGQGIPGYVARTGEIVALDDGTLDPRYAPLPSTLQHDFHAYLCAPLRIQEDTIGVLVLRQTKVHTFTRDEITTCEMICKQIAIVVEKARLYDARVEAEKLAAVAISLSGVAHYIKNLLLAMRGGEYLIETGLKRENFHQTSEGWGVLKRATSKIRDLVENMLNYYRDSTIHRVEVELNPFILEILQNLEDRAMQRSTVITPDLDMRIEKVELDPASMQDALINLITNAIDAIPEGRKGIVTVSSRLDISGKAIMIGIKDNGAGISEEHRKKMFHLFFSTKGRQGTGIGLAATKKIVLEHHGRIEFDSVQGEGTEFRIHLPLHQPQIASA